MQAAFLPGEIQDKDRVLYCWPPKNDPALPGVQPCSLLLILKGVFGLNDTRRKWWEKISKVFVQVGFTKQRMRLGLFTLHSSAGVPSGVICLHVDDMLGSGDDLFELLLKELEKLVGFGLMKRQKFDHCGRQYEQRDRPQSVKFMLIVTEPPNVSTREVIKISREFTEVTARSYGAHAPIELVPRQGWLKHLKSNPTKPPPPVLPTPRRVNKTLIVEIDESGKQVDAKKRP